MFRKDLVTSLVFFLLIVNCCYPQITKKDNFEPSILYPYKGHYINLENLKVVNNGYKSDADFKVLGSYNSRFSFPFWFEGFPRTATYKDHKFEINDSCTLKITQLATGKEIASVRRQNDRSSVGSGANAFLVATTQGVVLVDKCDGRAGYTVRKFDESGAELFKANFAHTFIDIGVYSQKYYPYLDYLGHTDRYMVFTSYDKRYPKTQLVDLSDGKLTSLDYAVSGFIRAEDEKTILGFVILDEDKHFIKVKFPTNEWSADLPNNYFDRAETLVRDSVLIIATWPNIATGSALAAYDLYTGKFLWKADVRQLNASHSQYFNAVTLSAFKDKLIMEGTEAYGNYLQIFSLGNGKRLYSEGF